MTGTPSFDYLNGLNDVQRQAVEQTDGPVLVVAGPGSGKTRVLTYRIAHLINTKVPPWEVLALTFTNKAAREMKERISKVVGDQANQVWAGTFHSIFSRILRYEADKIGYNSNFTIYDTDDTKSVLNAILKEMHLDPKTYSVNSVRSRISSAKSNLITPKLYERDNSLLEQDRRSQMPMIHKIYTAYVNRCKKSNAMDFDDLLFRLFELFQKNPDNILDKYRERFKYVLVDEFQDTNYLQYAIVRKLVEYPNSPRNICVVGDDAQSIYAFRGATIQNILDFEKDFGPHHIQVFKLEQNYRSTEHIVKVANSVIANNKNQIPKEIWSDKGEGNKIKVIKAVTDNEEGKRIADTIVEQRNRNHLHNKDIAILYRTNAQSRVFEEYLRRYNIPYRIFGGQSFYSRKEIKDLLGYLRLVVNPTDEEALKRVINYPKRGIGNTSMEKVALTANQLGITLWEALQKTGLPNRTASSVNQFIKLIDQLKQKNATSNAYDVAILAARESGLIDTLKADTSIEGMGRLENVNALLDGVQEFVENDEEGANEEKTLAAYLQNIALLTDQDDQDEDDNYVTLMSVHAAKGLEFKSIFLVGMEEKLFPSFMSYDDPDGMDEERRLFYVAITRAEAYLTLSWATSRYRFGQMRFNEPSRFLDEIPPIHLDASSFTSSSKGRDPEHSSGRSGVSGIIPPKRGLGTSRNTFAVDPNTFKPSPADTIAVGQTVIHLKFGKGEVRAIDGGATNRIATIYFEGLADSPERRIMLKFAKLQILD